jgi:hypothetical protein
MTKKSKIILAVIAILAVIGFIGQTFEKEKNRVTSTNKIEQTFDSAATRLNNYEKETTGPGNWSYAEEKDPMTDKVRYFATCTSVNLVDFAFPYDGGSYLKILIRKMNGKDEVILTITKGQFINSYSGSVKIKFDEEPVKSYSFNEASDGSSDVIFLNVSNGIIAKLKKAKKVKIQPEFYQAGQTVFQFDVEGLKWGK